MSEISKIVYAVSALLFIAAIYLLIFYFFIKALSKLFLWLYTKKSFKRLVSELQTRFKQAIKFTTPLFKFLWYIVEIFIDPIFYGGAIVAVYDRVQSINLYTQFNPQYKVWYVLEANMNYDVAFWGTFFTILSLWFLVKAKTYGDDKLFKKKMLSSMDNLNEKLGNANEKDIGLINKQIREKLKRIKEGK